MKKKSLLAMMIATHNNKKVVFANKTATTMCSILTKMNSKN